MANINLISTDTGLESSVTKLSRFLGKANLVGFILLTITTSVLFVYFLFSLISLNNSKSHQESLRNSIKALKDKETQLTLLYDRVRWAKAIYDKGNASSNLEKMETALGNVTSNYTINSVALTNTTGDVDLFTDSKEGFSQFMAGFKIKDLFTKVLVSSLSFIPQKGYTVTLTTSTK